MNLADNIDKNLPDWDDQAKKLFNEFKKRRRSLPSPSNVDNNSINISKRQKGIENENNKRAIRRSNIVDINRKILADCADVSMDVDFRSSTLSENFMSLDNIDNELDQTEVMCDKFEMDLASTLELIKNRADLYEILEKIVNNLSQNYKKMRELVHKVNNDCATRSTALNHQMVALENDLINKISSVNEKNDIRFKALELTQKCKNENDLVWLSFTDQQEIENLRLKSKSELIKETKNVFTRMNISLSSAIRTIVDVFIQKVAIKTNKGFENELIMGIRFLNSNVARDIKRLITNYAKNQFMLKNFDAIRYVARDNWSSDIWKLLRVCYDLSRLKLIDGSSVSDAGILVYHKSAVENSEENTLLKTIIRTETDLDELRKNIGDICPDVPTFQFYHGEYFKLNFDQRNDYRNSQCNARKRDDHKIIQEHGIAENTAN